MPCVKCSDGFKGGRMSNRSCGIGLLFSVHYVCRYSKAQSSPRAGNSLRGVDDREFVPPRPGSRTELHQILHQIVRLRDFKYFRAILSTRLKTEGLRRAFLRRRYHVALATRHSSKSLRQPSMKSIGSRPSSISRNGSSFEVISCDHMFAAEIR
jgi:hypothetical protein